MTQTIYDEFPLLDNAAFWFDRPCPWRNDFILVDQRQRQETGVIPNHIFTAEIVRTLPYRDSKYDIMAGYIRAETMTVFFVVKNPDREAQITDLRRMVIDEYESAKLKFSRLSRLQMYDLFGIHNS